ncbi:hypothetical protein ACMD2_09187 [Ananas comosus]|uniref:Uncharacterized protein n=1 Tax=Ananas comosus TaxID=4615 RepID=A0A199WAU4_ANACO|nr:hypothetical protein ACMD2_09187 [Ananas comosus]
MPDGSKCILKPFSGSNGTQEVTCYWLAQKMLMCGCGMLIKVPVSILSLVMVRLYVLVLMMHH